MSTAEMTSHALAEECAEMICAGFPSYWNKPLFPAWRKTLTTMLLRKPAAVSKYLADPETGLAARATYLPDGVERLKAFRKAEDAVTRAEQQTSEIHRIGRQATT